MAHKLLLADDSVTIQRVIELTFADEDIEVTAVGDGQTAIDRLDADPPDIILADIDMPGRDGYEVAAYVKSRPKLAHIPVVLLTGAFEPIDQARAATAGSSDVLAKPFEPQMVINRVKELLGRKRADAGYAAREDAPSQVMPPLSDPQPAGDSSQTVSLDDYFDQLDAAFSNLQPGVAPSNGSDEDWPADLDTRAAAVTAPPVMVADPAPQEPLASMPAVAAPVAPAAPVVPVTPTVPAAPVAPAAAPVAPVATETYVPQAAHVQEAPIPAPAPDDPIVSSAHVAAPEPVAPVAPAAVALVSPAASVAASAPTFAPTASAAHIADAPIAPASAPVATAAFAPIAPVKPSSNPFATLTAAKAEAAARPVVISDEVIEQIVSRVLQRMSDQIVRETVTDIVSQTAERLVQEEIERIRTEA